MFVHVWWCQLPTDKWDGIHRAIASDEPVQWFLALTVWASTPARCNWFCNWFCCSSFIGVLFKSDKGISSPLFKEATIKIVPNSYMWAFPSKYKIAVPKSLVIQFQMRFESNLVFSSRRCPVAVRAAPTVTVPTNTIQSKQVTVQLANPTPGPNEGSISSYGVQYRLKDKPGSIASTSERSQPFQISGLEIYTLYEVRVNAESNVGEGVWSSWVEFRTDSAREFLSSNFP